MDNLKLLLGLFLFLAGWILYMVYAGERSTGAWIVLGILAVTAAAVSLILLKENPEILLRALLFTALLFSIFAGMLWFYTRDRASGIVTAVALPIAIVLSIWLLRPRHPEVARYDKAIVEYLNLWRDAPSEEEHQRLARERFGLDEDDVAWVNQVLVSAALGTLGNYANGQDDPWWQAALRLSQSSQRKLLVPLRESVSG